MVETEKRRKIPLGVKLISILYFLAGISSILIAILSFTYPNLFNNIPDFNLGSFGPQVMIMFGIVMLILSVISFIVAVGLLKRKNWARITVIVISIINILGGILSIIEGSWISSINLIVNLVIVLYLTISKKVRIAFS
jgi:hypothetical protein